VKDIFAKKFLVPGEIPLAARSHRFAMFKERGPMLKQHGYLPLIQLLPLKERTA
jgi:hypothetical protein